MSGLDPKVTAEMYDLIAQLNRDGLTVIMISHDIEAALRYADRIMVIDGGEVKVAAAGSAEQSGLLDWARAD